MPTFNIVSEDDRAEFERADPESITRTTFDEEWKTTSVGALDAVERLCDLLLSSEMTRIKLTPPRRVSGYGVVRLAHHGVEGEARLRTTKVNMKK